MSDTDLDQFREYLDGQLKAAFELDELNLDDDGDWPFVFDGTTVWVRASQEPALHAFVFARVASAIGVDALAEINQLNSTMAWAKIQRSDDGDVFVVQAIFSDGANAATMRVTVEAIAQYTRDCGPLLEAVYGGATALPKRTTPSAITSLPEDGVFVFGSGATAQHSGGAARLAHERFGAERGTSQGLAGQSYALPSTQGLSVLRDAVVEFIRFAASRPDLDFYVTRLGCGHAGLDEDDVAGLFRIVPANVIKPRGW